MKICNKLYIYISILILGLQSNQNMKKKQVLKKNVLRFKHTLTKCEYKCEKVQKKWAPTFLSGSYFGN
jgi:hypothetical protein